MRSKGTEAKGTKIETYRDLLVWQKSMTLVTGIYRMTKSFPQNELYGLTSQIRRSAVSIPSNIAEGYGRRSRQDYIRFLQIAMGSLFELQTQLQIAVNLEYVAQSQFETVNDQTREIERMMSSLISKLKA